MRYFIAICLAVFLIGSACVKNGRFTPVPQEGAPWAFHRGTVYSSGAYSTASFSGKLKILWQRKQNDKPVGPLTLSGGGLFYPTSRKKLKIFDPVTGKTLAQIKTFGSAQSGAVMTDSVIFFGVGAFRNELVAYKPRTGKTLWESPIKDAAYGSILWMNRLFIGTSDRDLRAFDISDGRKIWSTKLVGKPFAPPSVSGEKIIQPTDAGKLYALSCDSGLVLFEVDLGSPLMSAVVCGNLIWATDLGGTVYGIDSGTGQTVWKNQIDGPIWSSPAVTAGRLFAVNSGGDVIALDALTGTELWRRKEENVIRAAPLVVGNCVIVATLTGRLTSMRTVDGALMDTLTLVGPISVAPITDGSRIYVATDAGRITCVGEADATQSTTGDTSAIKRRSK